MPEFVVPSEFEGQSLKDLRRSRSEPFRSDIVAGLIGVGESDPLRAGQLFNVALNDPGSAEQQFIRNVFGSGAEFRQTQARTEAERQASEARRLAGEAVQPAIETLQAQQQPLQERYSKIIEDIQAQRGLRTKQAETAVSREFGKRGIPLSSGVFDVGLQERRLPIDVQFGSLLQQAGGEQESKLLQLANAIAALQSTGGLAGFQAGQDVSQFVQSQAQQAGQFAQTLAEQIRQSGVSEELQRLQLEQSKTPDSPFTTLGEGSTLFNLLTGQPVFTAPKTFKQTAQGRFGGDPLGLF